jgi:hypothetical protein
MPSGGQDVDRRRGLSHVGAQRRRHAKLLVPERRGGVVRQRHEEMFAPRFEIVVRDHLEERLVARTPLFEAHRESMRDRGRGGAFGGTMGGQIQVAHVEAAQPSALCPLAAQAMRCCFHNSLLNVILYDKPEINTRDAGAAT